MIIWQNFLVYGIAELCNGHSHDIIIDTVLHRYSIIDVLSLTLPFSHRFTFLSLPLSLVQVLLWALALATVVIVTLWKRITPQLWTVYNVCKLSLWLSMVEWIRCCLSLSLSLSPSLPQYLCSQNTSWAMTMSTHLMYPWQLELLD